MSQQQKQSKVLLNSAPMIVPVEIANALGLEQAMLLQQIHYWVQTKLENPQKFQDSKQQGHMWVYKSARQMHEEMPFLGSESKIKRIIAELKQKMILVVDNFNKHPMDKTGWYRINYQALKNAVGSVATIESGQDEPPKDLSEPTKAHDESTIGSEQTDGEGKNDSLQGCSLTQAIPKTTPKTTTKNTTEIKEKNIKKIFLDVFEKMPCSSATEFHQSVARLFSESGFDVQNEYSLGRSYEIEQSRKGRIDLLCEDMDGFVVAIELDWQSPRKKSIAKLRHIEADLKIIGLRENSGKDFNLDDIQIMKPDQVQKKSALDESFDEFFSTHPKKFAEETARKYWKKMPAADRQTALDDVKMRVSEDWTWIKEGGKFAPRPLTYLREKRWKDVYEPNPTDTKNYPGSVFGGCNQYQSRPLTAGAAQQAKNRDFIQRRLAEVRAQNNG